MELIKDIVLRKHQEFFLGLKNNRFSPMPFFEAISVANAELCVLSKREKSLRESLISKDENLLSSIYKKFKIDPSETRKILVYPDIRQKWSIGVLKGQSYGNR